MVRFLITLLLILAVIFSGCSDDTAQPGETTPSAGSTTSSSTAGSDASASVSSIGGIPEELMISEYVEGSGNNKYIELFNWTGHDINLGIYKLRIYINGATAFDHELALSGSLTNGQTFVIANKFADKWSGTPDMTDDTVLTFNGNDVIELVVDNIVVDTIGTVGDSSDFAKDLTLRRKPWRRPSDSWVPDQWYICPLNDVSGIGIHDWMSESGKPDTNSTALPVDYPDGSDGSSVYISEYFEGDGNDKYVEIYNGGSSAVDLSQYVLVRHDYDAAGNRNATNDFAVQLSGTLYANNCFLIANGGYSTNDLSNLYSLEGYNFLKEDVSVYPQAICFYGGNDPIMLVHNGSVIDRVGSGGTTVWGKNLKLIRKSGRSGSVTWNTDDWESTITKYSGVSGTISGSDATAGIHTP